MFGSTEANVSCNNLSVAETYEHVNSRSSPTPPLVDRQGQKARGSRSSSNTPGAVAPENPRVGAASPMAVLTGTPMSAHVTPLVSI
jgi:hypothetical protein